MKLKVHTSLFYLLPASRNNISIRSANALQKQFILNDILLHYMDYCNLEISKKHRVVHIELFLKFIL